MKCPHRYQIAQKNVTDYIYNDNQLVEKQTHVLAETQQFCECLEQECACYNFKEKICRKEM